MLTDLEVVFRSLKSELGKRLSTTKPLSAWKATYGSHCRLITWCITFVYG